MDSMRYAKEVGKLIRDGPEDDEPSLLKTIVGVVLHWRMWAGAFIICAGAYAVTLLTGVEDPAAAGWIVGVYTAVLATLVIQDD